MKTQLLQDFQESGSAPGVPKPIDPPPPAEAPARVDVPAAPDGVSAASTGTPAASADTPAASAGDPVAPGIRPRPAVWHGPGAQRGAAGPAVQRADPGTMQRAPDKPARGLGVAIEAWAERAAQRPPAGPAMPAGPAVQAGPAAQPEAADEATLPGLHAHSRPGPPPGPPPPPVQPPPVQRPPVQPSRVQPPPVQPPPVQPSRVQSPPIQPPPIQSQPEPPPSPPESRADPGTIPRPVQPEAEADWLAARMRAEASLRETPAWSSMWKRRLVTWSIAGGLLAGLAAGGLWLYEENRVDDALVVVANTSPAGPPPPAAASGAQPFAAGAPAATAGVVKPVPASPEPEGGQAPAPLPPVAATPVADTLPAAVPPPVEASPATVDVNPPRRTSRHSASARKRAAAKARRTQAQAQDSTPDRAQGRAPVAATPSPRQRREETLMQCRAHGYDERQCIQRACTMTRYGLACKG